MTHDQLIALVEKMRAAQNVTGRVSPDSWSERRTLEAQVDAAIRQWRKEREEKQGSLFEERSGK